MLMMINDSFWRFHDFASLFSAPGRLSRPYAAPAPMHTRKLSYHKDDRAMCPTYGVLKIFEKLFPSFNGFG